MSSQVRCTICGAVFDSDITVCPVCGKGPEFFVPVEPTPVHASLDNDMSFVILGGGPAGLSAAEAIRQRNATASITLLSDEEVFPYNRPMLTKAFDPEASGLPVHTEAWYAEHRIDVRTNARITELAAEAKVVSLEDGTKIPYDRCIYALGAASFIPPIPGTDLPEVSVIRCVRDIRHIRTLLGHGKRKAIVIGGGVLGLEAAWTLKKLGCDVIVIEFAPRIMARQVDEETSSLLAAAVERSGITLLTGTSAEAIMGREGHVESVLLPGDLHLTADLVILSVGVRANVGIAKAAGAAVGHGVKVNGRMETSLADVYACGDCAEPEAPTAQLWPVAAEMGRVAGANAAGEAVEYVPASFAVTFHGMDTQLYAEGDVGLNGAEAYRIETVRDEAAQTLDKRYYVHGKLRGAILLGDIHKAKAYSDEMRK